MCNTSSTYACDSLTRVIEVAVSEIKSEVLLRPFGKFVDSLNDSIPLDSFVSVRYPLEKFSSIIKIPETALFDKKYVFVIENGRAKKIEVNVLLSNSSYYLLKKERKKFFVKVPIIIKYQKLSTD